MKTFIITPLIALLAVVACSNSEVKTDPPPPALKTIILDRQGRPAINTALNGLLSDTALKNVQREGYNASDFPEWIGYQGELAANLAVYDSLDTVCGNQVLAATASTAGRYNSLATALADDQIYVNTNSGVCAQYLAVELNATAVAPNDDCGGRTLTYDVIDTTYSALAVGAVSGVGDGVPRDEENHSDENFPFLAPP